MDFKAVVFCICVLSLTSLVSASSQKPNLQEMRAQREVELINMQKQQQVGIFKRRRDELLADYKGLMRVKNDAYGQMKIAEKDYKKAMAKLEKAKAQQFEVEAQIGKLLQDKNSDELHAQSQIKKLRDQQTSLISEIKSYSQIQQASYENMKNFDNQYRSFASKEPILKQQIESVQRQLQFVLSQP
ncbi:MAG: hypothetical protein H6754_02200 [Candidatus Omnitrophica bacterium]|nr:hypothetical protein [Candidatus Omnitrophota bacterium]